MPINNADSPRRTKRTWLFPAMIAALALIADVAGNIIATDLDQVLRPYRSLVWGIFAVALVAAIIGAIRDSRKSNETGIASVNSPMPARQNVVIQGNVTSSTIITGSRNAEAMRSHRTREVGDDVNEDEIGQKQRVELRVNANHEIIANLSELAAQTVSYVRSVMHQLPPLAEHFIGREKEINTLCAGIRRQAQQCLPTVITSAITGMGGVGKTALAVAAAHKLAAEYSDAQIVLCLAAHSNAPASPEQVRDALLQEVSREVRLPDEERVRWGLYQAVFRKPDGQNKKALLIIDDARDDQQVRPLLPPAGCAVLITSRRRLETGETLQLTTLPRLDATALLRQYRQTLTSVDADALAALCGDLPVALRVAGGFLKQHESKPTEEYLTELQADRLKRLESSESSLDTSAIFGHSVQKMKEKQRLAFARLSVMHAAFDRPAALEVGQCGGDELDELVALNLLEYDREAGRYNWHELVAEHSARQLPQLEAIEARQHHAEHYCKVADQVMNLFNKGGDSLVRGLAMFDLERRNIEDAFEFLGSQSGMSSLLVKLTDTVLHVARLRFLPQEHIQWSEAQLRITRELGDRSKEGNALANLGMAYTDMGDVRKAIGFHEQDLKIAREIGDRRGEGWALGNIGGCYCFLGDVRKAIEFYNQHLKIAREIQDRRGEAGVLGNMGVAYLALGESHKSIEYFEGAWKIELEIGNRHQECLCLGNLGVAYAAEGKARKAIEFHEQALKIACELGDQRAESNALGNLGNVYRGQGDTGRAIHLHEQQFKKSREVEDRRDESNALGNLGQDYQALGEAAKAIEFLEQQLEITRAIGDRCGEGRALSSIGNSYSVLGNPDKAICFYEQNLKIARETADRKSEGTALGNLGIVYSALREMDKGIEFFEQHLRIAREIWDRKGEHKALANLGSAYLALGEVEKANKYCEESLRIALEIGDRQGEGQVIGNLGNVQLTLGDARSAIKFHERSLEVAREIKDRQLEGTLLVSLGNDYNYLEDTYQALEYYDKALEISREIGDRLQEGLALSNSARIYHELGNLTEAIGRAETALAIYEEIRDPIAANLKKQLQQWREGVNQ